MFWVFFFPILNVIFQVNLIELLANKLILGFGFTLGTEFIIIILEMILKAHEFFFFFTACECNLSGSSGITCDQFSGQCDCRSNFQGRKCEQCTEGFHNYPACQECNCDPAGVIDVPGQPLGGCGSATAVSVSVWDNDDDRRRGRAGGRRRRRRVVVVVVVVSG